MGIDGFSMSNLGLSRNLTSSQLATNAERTAQEALDSQISDMDGVNKKDKVGRQDADAAFNGHIPFVPLEEEEGDGQGAEENTAAEQPAAVEESEDEESDGYEKYHFRFNANEMIEIYDTATNTVVRTISPEDASKAMLNISKMPGIFVNKKI